MWRIHFWQVAQGVGILVALLGVASNARSQTVTIDGAAGHAIPFDPDVALGSSMDILPANLIDRVYSEEILRKSLSAGWGPITYRQNTELTIADWHWNEPWNVERRGA